MRIFHWFLEYEKQILGLIRTDIDTQSKRNEQ